MCVIQPLLFLLLLFSSSQLFAGQNGINAVAVIAPSVSTSIEARLILREKGWTETGPKIAQYVLVVCRSMLYNPLMSYYDSYCDLETSAERQLNIAGQYFHIYLYSIANDLSVQQTDHASYEANR